jgi:hemerythrin
MNNRPENLDIGIISWKPEYSTGNHEVDLQHQYFFQLIHRLNGDLKKTGDIDYRNRLLWELNKYVEFHFQSEENILLKSKNEGFENMVRLHESLTEELAGNVQSAMAGMISPEEIITFLANWFLRHTVEDDKKVFLQNQG